MEKTGDELLAEKMDMMHKNMHEKYLYLSSFAKDKMKGYLSAKVILFIGMLLVIYFAPEIISGNRLFATVFEMVFYYLILNFMFTLIRITILTYYYRKNGYQAGHYDDMVVIINRVSFLINHIIYLFVALYLLGINLTTILTSISIFAAALALIFRDIISNFINGFQIIFSKNLDIRDYVRMGEFEGRLVDMSFTHTKLRPDSGDEIFIPNSLVMSKEFVNLSRIKTKKFIVQFGLPFKYFGTIKNLEQYVAEGIAKDFKANLTRKDIDLKITKTDHEVINMDIEIYLNKYSYELEQEIRKKCFERILDFVNKQKV